jgi:hypothetical protein
MHPAGRDLLPADQKWIADKIAPELEGRSGEAIAAHLLQVVTDFRGQQPATHLPLPSNSIVRPLMAR